MTTETIALFASIQVMALLVLALLIERWIGQLRERPIRVEVLNPIIVRLEGNGTRTRHGLIGIARSIQAAGSMLAINIAGGSSSK